MCKISRWNSKRLLRKPQKILGGYFFDAPCRYRTIIHSLLRHKAAKKNKNSKYINQKLVCLSLSICLFANKHNSKTNDPKVFKLGTAKLSEWLWDILEMMWFWGWKVKGQGHRINKCIFFTLMTITPMLNHIWLTTAIRRGLRRYNIFAGYTITRKILERSAPFFCWPSRDSWPAWVYMWVLWLNWNGDQYGRNLAAGIRALRGAFLF